MTLQRKPMTHRYRPTGFSRPTRALILDRDGWVCAVQLACEGGPTLALFGHHRRNRQMGGSTDPATNTAANGVACCGPCNSAMESDHDVAGEARDRGLKLPQGSDPSSRPVMYPDGSWWLLRADGTRTPYEAQDGAA